VNLRTLDIDRDRAVDRTVRPGAVVTGAALVALPLVDAAVPLVGRAGQLAVLAVAVFALRNELRAALRRPHLVAALLGTVTVVVVAVATGMRFGTDADQAYLVRLGILLPVWIAVGAAIVSDDRRIGFFDGVVLGSVAGGLLHLTGSIPGAGHIEAGRAISVAIPIVTYAPMFRRSPAPRLARFAVAVFLIVAALSTGARGPVVFASVTIVALAIVKGSSGPNPLLGVRTRRVVVAALALTSIWVAFGTDLLRFDTDSRQLQRQQELLAANSIEDIASARVRIDDLWGPAVELIGEYPVTGTGLPASLVLVDAGNRYPHNLVLEFGVAFGVGGLLIGIGVVAAVAVLAWRARHDAPMLAALGVHQTLNSMVSADLGMNRWVFLGLAGLATHDWLRRRRAPGTITERAVTSA